MTHGSGLDLHRTQQPVSVDIVQVGVEVVLRPLRPVMGYLWNNMRVLVALTSSA